MTSTAAAVEQTDVLEERIIDAEYKIWKKNTPYLYDFVMTHSLEWPSLTCEWLPTVRNTAGPESVEHSLLIGTHTTGEQNYLMVASCNLPVDEAVIEDEKEKKDEENAPNSSGGSGSSANNNNKKAPPAYDEEKKELGAFGHADRAVGKIEIKMKIKHEGEVNRARHMPSNHFIVASRGPNPEVYIFDLSKHSSFPSKQTTFSPQGVCIGHEREGYAMEWSKQRPGILLTGSDDATIRLWDIASLTSAKAQPPGTQIKPLASFVGGHTATVEDVDWHGKDEHMFGSVGDDRIINIWDDRQPAKAIHSVKDAHEGDINGIAFNPVKEFLFVTGSADKTVKMWDLRSMKCVETLQGHTDQVYKVEWAPFNESILASCSDDRRVAIWDLARIGKEQSPEDAEDGPPELLFLHGGHTSKVSDFSWNSKHEWTIASVSEDNVLQVWNLAEEIYADDDAEEEDDEADGKDGLLQDDELED